MIGPLVAVQPTLRPELKEDAMTRQQKEDRARICAQLGITKEQYNEIDRACAKANRWLKRLATQRLTRRARREQ